VPIALEFGEPSTFTVHAAGRVTYAECEMLLDELQHHPRLCCGVQVYVDGRNVESTPSTSELRAIARDLRPLVERGIGPIAFVAEKPFIYGVGRMFSVFAEAMGATVRAFRSEDEAHHWLTEHVKPAA
jgi:hypothetical protein